MAGLADDEVRLAARLIGQCLDLWTVFHGLPVAATLADAQTMLDALLATPETDVDDLWRTSATS